MKPSRQQSLSCAGYARRRRRVNRLALNRTVAIAALATLCIGRAATAQLPADVTAFLHHVILLDTAQLAAAERGDVVVKVLPTGDTRDVTLFGIVAAPMSRDAYVRLLENFAAGSPSTRQLHGGGVFSTPATAADMQRFALSAGELNALRKCQRDDCKFKLPGAAMDTARELFQGPATQQLARATAYARERLARYVNDYRARGSAALVVYDDEGHVPARDAFDRLLIEAPYGARYSELVTRHFELFPADTLPDSTDEIFWTIAQAPRLRPTLMLWHRVVYAPADRPNLTLIAAKQIFADHYFEAAFDLTSVLTRSTTPGSESCYVVVLRRYRFDALPQGILRIHDRAVNALRDGLTSELEQIARR